MLSAVKSQAELLKQRNKLASSYNALLDEFSSSDLHQVGNYTLSHLIGKGSFGKVYLAEHKLTNGSKVVLKSADKHDQNLAREIHHHRQFLHPHIARLYEVIVTESLVWLVLEYCPGDELYHYLTQHGALEPSMVQRIFAQLVGAVSYVHNKSCVHRDLKLENILLDKNGNVKLVDFGFTREYEGKASYLQTWCGTVCYSAPEMLKGEKYAGEKVDVWSLGVILYALLTGELPFDDDDETVTKQKILKEEPKYPESMPQPAKDLINLLLSKRPLLRPALSDILTNPWLAEHAPNQQAILKLQQPPPFATPLEKDVLQRMRSAGVDIDMVIENVLSQRCDALAGWWALLLEKEERKAKRRERKRKEKEAEAKALRRISAASGRMAPTIMESVEEGHSTTDLADNVERGRDKRRPTNGSATAPALEDVAERSPFQLTEPSPPAPASRERNTIRNSSASRRRSQLGAPRDGRRRNSTLQMVTSNPNLMASDIPIKKRRRYQAPFISQLASIKHWFQESTRRSKSPTSKQNNNFLRPDVSPRTGPNKLRRAMPDTTPNKDGNTPGSPQLDSSQRSAYPVRPRISTNTSISSARRMSHSPSPLTPSSSYRRSGLRGRKSTSSSVSSVRSMHGHHPSHSKASSTSSNSLVSPSLSTKSISAVRRRSSPGSSIKVLPGTPTSSSFPSNIRVVRGPPPALSLQDHSTPGPSQSAQLSPNPFGSFAPGPTSPGLVFAKRRRSPFKGPMLGRRRSDTSQIEAIPPNRRSGTTITEEDEDDFEEVDELVTPVDDAALASGVDARLQPLAAAQEEDEDDGPRPTSTMIAAANVLSLPVHHESIGEEPDPVSPSPARDRPPTANEDALKSLESTGGINKKAS